MEEISDREMQGRNVRVYYVELAII